MDDYSFWDGIKEIPGIMWGDSWTGIDSVGRYICLAFGAVVLFILLMAISDSIRKARFAASCKRRGGHMHVRVRDHGPGIGIIVGNVVVPTRNTSETWLFVKGKQSNCRECNYG
jgi:hypothetical protein